MDPSLQQAYNDNAIQYGSIIATIKRGQPTASATVGVYILENVTISRPTGRIDRPDEIGGPNGFVLINKQQEGNTVVQMGDAMTSRPLNGDWFEHTFVTEYQNERFVLGNSSDPREMNGYFKGNYSLQKANFPAVNPNPT